MKKPIILLALGAICASPAVRAQRTVEKPAFLYRNSAAVEIASVGLDTGATVIRILTFPRSAVPVRTDGGTFIRIGDRKLTLVSADTLTNDPQDPIATSGTCSLELTFPAIDPATQTFDLAGGESADNFRIYGIRLCGSALPDRDAPPMRTGQCTDPIAPPVIDDRPALYSGAFEGYRPEFFDSFEVQAVSPLYPDGTIETVVPVRPDGTFSAELPVLHPVVANANVPGYFPVPFYVEPGRETVQRIDLAALSRNESRYWEMHVPEERTVTHSGELARVNDELARILRVTKTLLDSENYFWARAIDTLPPDEYRQTLLADLEKKLRMTDTLDACPRALEVGRKMLRSRTVCDLMDYRTKIEYAHRFVTGDFSPDTPLGIEIETPGESYYDFLKDYPLNDETMLVGTPCVKAAFRIREYLIDRSPVTRHVCGGITYVLDDFLSDSATIAAAGGDRGVFFDMARFKQLDQTIERHQAPDDIEEAATGIGNPAFRRELLRRYRKTEEFYARNDKGAAGVACELPDGDTPEAVYQAILDRYRGKAVFIDFWETWCGPCRRAIAEAAPVKEEFAGRDVVFVHIAGQTSPLMSWRNTIPSIRGEHYRLPADVGEYAMKRYGIRSVPSYLILDKEGKQVLFQRSFMGAERMKEILTGLCGD